MTVKGIGVVQHKQSEPGKSPADLVRLLLSQSADDVALGFDRLAARATGEARRAAWQRASRAFFQTASAGRPAIDDTALLSEVEMLIVTGKAASLHIALSRVARRAAGMAPSAATYERLRRKWRLQFVDGERAPSHDVAAGAEQSICKGRP